MFKIIYLRNNIEFESRMTTNSIVMWQINQLTQIQLSTKMAQNQHHEKKQFSVPSRDELIQSIKQLDQDIEHVTLNLIKCDFNATQNDIRKTFPEFNLIKVKNYNPGSFEVVFEMRIDAINFIRNHYDKKILNRRFFIKMGRQQKEVIEDWTGVGNMPRQFRGPKPHHQNKPGQPRTKKPEGQKTQQNNQETTTQQKPKQQTKTQTKLEIKHQNKIHQQPKKQGKVIPKFDNHAKKSEHKKANYETGQKKTETHMKREGEHQAPKHVQTQHAPKKIETQHTTKHAENHQTKQEQTHNKSKKEGEKKEIAHKKQEKTEAKKETVQEAAKEDDGWITVPTTKNPRRR